MNHRIKNFVARLTGNSLAQRLLEKNIWVSQYLMGIGAGGIVESSGEAAVISFLQRNIRPPYCIFDAGSNQGQYLRLLLDMLSELDFTVYCFEPSWHTFNILKKNSSNNQKIKLNHMALGKEPGEMTLYFNQPGSGLAAFTKRRLEHLNLDFDHSEIVPVTTINQYCFEQGIQTIQLLKVDVCRWA